jgi:hypothetical protein
VSTWQKMMLYFTLPWRPVDLFNNAKFPATTAFGLNHRNRGSNIVAQLPYLVAGLAYRPAMLECECALAQASVTPLLDPLFP